MLAFILNSEHMSVKNEKLRANHDTATGFIKGFEHASRSRGGYIVFSFSVNGKDYENDKFYDTMHESMVESLKNVPLTVVYQVGDTSNSQILIRQREYMKFGVTIPDTIIKLNYF